MGTRLYVGNLPFSIMESELSEMFSQAGKVVNCNLITDKFTGKSRGFAFVEMAGQDEATKAISMYNGKDFGGRQMTVNEARPREERPPRRDGGDYGGGGREGGGGGRGGREGGGGGRFERRSRDY
jgi:RNA recognition motif-containing protein